MRIEPGDGLKKLVLPWKKETVGKDDASFLISQGEQTSRMPVPELTNELWERYAKSGERLPYENPYFQRRRMLCDLVLAEFCEGKGRFVLEIERMAKALLDEPAWWLPAHNSYVRDTPALLDPDPQRPIVELFSAETAMDVMTACQVVAIDPLLKETVRREVRHRIIEPYLSRHFWWMGQGMEPMCNWTPWCTSNILIAYFLAPGDKEEQHRIVAQAIASIGFFLKDYGPDGCCPEGAAYWHHASGTLFTALQVLEAIGCKVDWQDEQLGNMASYLEATHASGPWWCNWGDSSARPQKAGVREYLFGKCIDRTRMMGFSQEQLALSSREERLLAASSDLALRLQAAACSSFCLEEQLPPLEPEAYHAYPSQGLYVWKPGNWVVGVHAGTNGWSHEHNDLGAPIVYYKGKPWLIDVGIGVYTKATFSPSERKKIRAVRSPWHNVGNFPENEQSSLGSAEVLEADEKHLLVRLDDAYKQYMDYQRLFFFTKKQVDVTELWPGGVLTFMSQTKPQRENQSLYYEGLGSLLFNRRVNQIIIEEIPVTDARLRESWTGSIWRVLVTVQGPVSWTLLPEKGDEEEEET